MDVGLFLRVLWRFRLLLAAGVALTLVLAFLAYVRIGFEDGSPRVSYRSDETWQSESLLLITQRGFPWGRSVIDTEPATTDGAAGGKAKTPQFADANRAGYLAILYATLAMSDPVHRIVRQDGPLDGTLKAAPVLASETLDPKLRLFLRYESPLPLVRVTAQSASPVQAQALARREVAAFLSYLEHNQAASRIPRDERVVVTQLEQPAAAERVHGRSKIYPALVLVAGVALSVALAFVAENLRPRTRPALAARRRPA